MKKSLKILLLALALTMPRVTFAVVDMAGAIADGFVVIQTNAMWREFWPNDGVFMWTKDITIITRTNRGYGDTGTVGSMLAPNFGFVSIVRSSPAITTNNATQNGLVFTWPSYTGDRLLTFATPYLQATGTNVVPQPLINCATNIAVDGTGTNVYRLLITGRLN